MILVKRDLGAPEPLRLSVRSITANYLEGVVMADEANRNGPNPILAVLLAIAVIGAGVLGYLYYQSQREVVKIDVPGFKGSITKGDGVDIEVGKDK